MPVLTMAAIDVLRGEANALIKERRKLEANPRILGAVGLETVRATLAGMERQIDQALETRRKLPSCPFCPGKLLVTPTVGRMECDRCKAMALRGRV